MPQGGDTSSQIDAGRLRKDLATCAGSLDWRKAGRFDLDRIPALRDLLRLGDPERGALALRDVLHEIREQEEAKEEKVAPEFGRSLVRAWTIMLRLDEEWEGLTLDPRHEELMKTWCKRNGDACESINGFRIHQDPEIYAELADRLLDFARARPELNPSPPSRPRAKPRPRTPWPVRGHEPRAEQEIVILVAAHAMRTGPTSGLVKLVREFEPYWRATETMLYALEGTYREIWRAGLLHDYEHFAPLTAGSEGGVVHATEVVIAAAETEHKRRAHVVYLVDPHDSSSLYPASASLKRECLLTHTPFLTSDRGAGRWFRLEWARRATESASSAASENLLVAPPEGGFTGGPLVDTSDVLALAAHDRHKLAMMEFAERHEELIDSRFPTRWATQATGHVLNGGLLTEGEYQDHVLSDESDRAREQLRTDIDAKVSGWGTEERTSGPGSPDWIPQLTFGRQGGVIQLAGKVLKEECDTVLFFQDAETAREHDTEIQVLDRAAQLTRSSCLLLHDASSADRWAENLEICLRNGDGSTATTLVEAFRRVFEVELVLVHSTSDGGRKPPRREKQAALWERITATAAKHIVGALRAAADGRSERDEPIRFGFPWGGAVRDILGEVTPEEDGRGSDRRALAGALGLHHLVDDHGVGDLPKRANTSERGWLPQTDSGPFFRPDELRVVPTVGVIGASDRSLEAHSLVERAVQILGGEGVLYPESAFALADGNKDPWGGAPQYDWERLDVLLLSAAPLQDRSKNQPTAMATGLPADLAAALSECTGAVGTIYLEEVGGEVRQPKNKAYRQVGLDIPQIEALKSRGAEVVLVNGAEEDVGRVEATWAALKAGLATTFITDETFAWSVLTKQLAGLKPPARRR